MASGDEKFNVGGVKSKMGVIEGYFSDFATTLSDINAFIQTNVNASIESAAFGDLGGKLLNIWDYNASTFNDFHENFDNWAQVVAIIAANNNQFAVDALATYRDNAGTLDGVQEARQYVAANNGVSNSGSNYGTLSNAAKSIIDSSLAQGSHIPDAVNMFGGKTVKKDDGTIEYYDADGNLVSYYKDGKYFDKDGKEIGGHEEYRKWLEEHGYRKPAAQGDVTLTETNNFGGKTVQKPDGTLEFYDADGKLIATKKGDKFYDADGKEIGDKAAYEKWLKEHNYGTDDVIIEENNNFGGDTVTKPDGTIEYRNADGEVQAYYKDGKFFDANGKEIGDAAAYREWLTENGHQLPKEGTLPGENASGKTPPPTADDETPPPTGVDDVYNMYNDPKASAEDRQKAYDALSDADKAAVDAKLAADFTAATGANAMAWSASDWSNYDKLPEQTRAKICEELGYKEIGHKDNHYRAVKNDGTFVEEYRDANGTATKKITYDGSVKTTEDYNNKTTKYEYDEARTVQGRDNVKSYEVKNDYGNETKTFVYEDAQNGTHAKHEVVQSDGSYEKTYYDTRTDGLQKETYSKTDQAMVQTYDAQKNNDHMTTKTVKDDGTINTQYNSDLRSDGLVSKETRTSGYKHDVYDSEKSENGIKEYTYGVDKSETTTYDPAKNDNISRVYTTGDGYRTDTTYGNGTTVTVAKNPDNNGITSTSTVTNNGITYTILNPNTPKGDIVHDSIHHGSTIYYANDETSYVDAITNMQPGDTVIVRVKTLEIDKKGTGSGTTTYSPTTGTDSLVLHLEEVNLDGTVKFSINGEYKSETYTKYDMIWKDAMKDTTWY